MVDILSEKIVTARVDHRCDACRIFSDTGYGPDDLSPDEWAVVEKARAEKNMILAGQQYRRAVYADGGQLWTFKARLDMDEINAKYKFGHDD